MITRAYALTFHTESQMLLNSQQYFLILNVIEIIRKMFYYVYDMVLFIK